MEYTSVSPSEFAASPGLDDWRFALGSIHASFRTGSFPAATDFAAAIAAAAEAQQHHPDIDIRYPDRVLVRVTTHAARALTDHDLTLAREISSLAAAADATSDISEISVLEIAIDTMDSEAIAPFWAAVLAYEPDSDGNLVDPLGRGPSVWFQQMDEPRPQRNRIHFDISVPHDIAEARVDAALAAGGTMVSDLSARSFWILADAEGNEICVCTWQDRG